MMKRLGLFFVAAAAICISAVGAFAQGSISTASVDVKDEVFIVTDENGNEVETYPVIIPLEDKDGKYTLKQEDLSTIKELPKDATLKNQYVVDLSLYDKETDKKVEVGTDQSITVTLYLPVALGENDEVWVRHWMHNGEVEVVKATIINPTTVTVTLKGVSPLDILVLEIAAADSPASEDASGDSGAEKGETEPAAPSTEPSKSPSGGQAAPASTGSAAKVSPKTGESSFILIIEFLAMLSLAGTLICSRKALSRN